MEILILGGTAMLGAEIALAALKRRHAVTCLARGSSNVPAGTSFVTADREDEDGLAAVKGRRWDAVVDVSRQPGQVRRAVRELTTGHWAFVSSGNVYADFFTVEQNEDAPIRSALEGEVMQDMSSYGEAKVACETAVRGADITATIIRSGLIGGPGDWSGRSGYWPWRFAHPTGDDVIVPDDLDFPCAMIDVRDLAAWVVIVCEQRLDGTFNVTGPTLTLRQVLSLAARVAESSARIRPVGVAELAELEVGAWMGPASLPLWIDDPQWRGFATMNTDRARAAGLALRPLEDTLRAALAYENERDGSADAPSRQAGLTDDEEHRIRAAL